MVTIGFGRFPVLMCVNGFEGQYQCVAADHIPKPAVKAFSARGASSISVLALVELVPLIVGVVAVAGFDAFGLFRGTRCEAGLHRAKLLLLVADLPHDLSNLRHRLQVSN